jgi:hypothetical protein
MPYGSVSELPPAVRARYSPRCQRAFMHAFNGHDGDEASRFAVGHSAAKQCMNAKGLSLDEGAGYPSASMGIEVKSFVPRDFDLKDSGEFVVAFAELDAVDHDKDYNYPGMIPLKDVPVSAYSHGSWPHRGGQLPVGRTSTSEDGKLALAKGRFFLNTTHGRDTYETVKEMGELQEWSYGMEPKELGPVPAGFKARRGLKSVDIREISPVLLGAGIRTATLAIKGLDDDGDLLAGEPYADELARVLGDLKAVDERGRAIHEIRLKEGRALSSARRSELNDIYEVAKSTVATLERLLADTEPKPKDEEPEGKARHLRIQALLGEAQASSATARGALTQ